MKGISAVQRSLGEMRSREWIAGVTERWNPHARIRQDLFGVFDLIAVTPTVCDAETVTTISGQIVGVQVKSDGDGARKAQEKIDSAPVARMWLDAGGGIEIWVWRRVKPRGTKQVRWKLRRIVAEAGHEFGIVWNEDES